MIVQDGKAVRYGLMGCIRKEGKNIVLCDRIYSCGAGNKVADQMAAYFNRSALGFISMLIAVPGNRHTGWQRQCMVMLFIFYKMVSMDTSCHENADLH